MLGYHAIVKKKKKKKSLTLESLDNAHFNTSFTLKSPCMLKCVIKICVIVL